MSSRALGVLRELALTVGAVAGVLCMVFTLLGATAGVRPLWSSRPGRPSR